MELEVKNLTSSYRVRGVVNEGIVDFSYRFQPGGVYALMGPNGSGKTTLLKSILGLKRFQEGALFFDGKAIGPLRNRFFKQNASVVLSEVSNLFKELTIRDNIRHFLLLNKTSYKEQKEAINHWVEAFKLGPHLNKVVFSCSYGTKRKAELLVAILKDPKLLILDEPFLGVDLESGDVLREALAQLSHERIVIVTSHDLRTISALSHERIFIRKGRMVHGPLVDEVIERLNQRKQIILESKKRIPSLEGELIESKGDSYKYMLPKERLERQISHIDMEFADISTYGNEIEDVYRELYREKEGGID